MTDRSERAIIVGENGELAVAQILQDKGYKVQLGQPGNADLYVEGVMSVEVKTATLSGRTDRQAKRWQFNLFKNDGWHSPFDEDCLILRCESNPPCHFIIPWLFIPERLTKIDITNPDPWKYKGKWAIFRELWELVHFCVVYSYFSGIVP